MPSAAANCYRVFFGGATSYFGEQVNFIGFHRRVLATTTNSSLDGSEREGRMVVVLQTRRCLVIFTERPFKIEAARRELDGEVTLSD